MSVQSYFIMKFINKYIAPWALPKGVIPFHCVWEPDERLKKISFLLPDNYELRDKLNFEICEYNIDLRTYYIKCIFFNL